MPGNSSCRAQTVAAMSSLAAEMVHEIDNPLTTVLDMTQVLRRRITIDLALPGGSRKYRDFRRVVLVCALVGSFSSGRAAGAQTDRSRIEGPTTIVGVGKRATRYQIILAPREQSRFKSIVEIFASAGTVSESEGEASASAPGFDWRPPRVVRERLVTLRVVLRVGRRNKTLLHRVTVTPAPVEQKDTATAGPYDLRGPARIDSTVTDRVAFTVARPAGGGWPDIHVSVGEVSALEDSGDGRLRAFYRPPQRSYPGIAIVAVVSSDRSVFDWMPVTLLGAARVNLDSEAGASVTVNVGRDTFGPVTMDRHGKSALWLLIPPGINSATTVAYDRVGNVETGTLPFQPPEFLRLLLVCPRDSGRALAFAVTAAGAPLENARISPNVSIGRLAPFSAVSAGVFASVHHSPSEVEIGDVALMDAHLQGRAASLARCEARIGGEEPDNIEISTAVPSRTSYVAGSGRPIEVTLKLGYPGHRPRLAVPVTIAVDLGEISPARLVASGEYWASWRLPDQHGGREQATLTAKAGAEAEATFTIELQPGPVARMSLTLSHEALVANGQDRATVDIEVADGFGNPVSHARLESTAPGPSTQWQSIDPGHYRSSFIARRSMRARDGIVRVTESRSGRIAEKRIRVLPYLRPRSASIRLGYIDNTGKVSGLALTVDVDHQLPLLDGRLSAGVSVGGYRSRHESLAAGTMDVVATQVDALPILARVGLVWPLGRWLAYGAIGAGVLYSDVTVASELAGTVHDRGWRPAWMSSVGAGLRLAPGWLIFETDYLHARVEESNTSGNLGGVRASLGYRYSF